MSQSKGDRRSPRIPWVSILKRGWGKRCPNCGRTQLFRKWDQPIERCAACGIVNEPRAGDIWAYHYIGTAAFTGLFIFIIFVLIPGIGNAGRIGLMIVMVAAMIWTTPRRKGLWIALDFLSKITVDHEKPPEWIGTHERDESDER